MYYEQLAAWRHCHRLATKVYAITRSWPSEEQFGLTSQVRRAAVSAAANIVEGSTRRGPREFRRFLDMARGSLAEATYLLRLAHELGYVQADDFTTTESIREQASKLTWLLYRSLKDKS